MNRLKNGTVAVGAPGSIARAKAEREDALLDPSVKRNGIVFYQIGELLASKQGKSFEVVTLRGSDGGPELVKTFATAEEAIDYIQETV